jgi:hypothetical protein
MNLMIDFKKQIFYQYLFAGLVILTSNNVRAQDSTSPPPYNSFLKELSKPISNLEGQDKEDETYAIKVIQEKDLQKNFKKISTRDLSNDGLIAYMTMLREDEFKQKRFELYNLGEKLFFFDKNLNGDLYLVDSFKPGGFSFTKISQYTQHPALKQLLKNFSNQRKEFNQLELRPLRDRLKDRIELISKVSEKEKDFVINSLIDIPEPILEDILDPDWGLNIKLGDKNQLLKKPSLLFPFLSSKQRTEDSARDQLNSAGAFYSNTSNSYSGGDLIIFTCPDCSRLKENIHHEIGHIVDQRLKFRFLTDKVVEGQTFGFQHDKTSFGVSDLSDFIDNHKIDTERFIANPTRLNFDSWLVNRLRYYINANSNSKNVINKSGAIETFAEAFASHLDTENKDPLAIQIKKFFPLSINCSKEIIKSVYGNVLHPEVSK